MAQGTTRGRTTGTGRRAVLIDLENLLHDDTGLLRAEDAGRVLARVLDLSGSHSFRLAIAPARVISRFAAVLHDLRIPREVVAPGPDAADLALLQQADHLVEIGYDEFVVVSADHIFSRLCLALPTTVIVRRGQPVSRELRTAASLVLAA